MAKQVELTWGDRMRLEGKREAVLTFLRSRFTTVPEELARRIEAIQSDADLERLIERAATVSHPDELRAEK